MLKIKRKDFQKSINLNKLATFAYKVKTELGNINTGQSAESIKLELEKLRDAYKFVIFFAYFEKELVGTLLMSVNFPKLGFIWDWQPIVFPRSNETEVAEELIKASIDFAKNGDINRLEAAFCFESPRDKQLYPKFVNWYESVGFYKVMEEISMELNLDEFKPINILIPKNIKRKNIKEVPINELKKSSYETFNNSNDVMYLDQNENQKQNVINEWFNPSKPLIEEASITLLANGKVIGFVVVRPSIEAVQIGPFGIVPSFRKKGLGQALLILCLQKLKEKGFKVVNLDVAYENISAYKLYCKVGFKRLFSTNLFALNL